jgi:hypothetical protein
VLRGNFALDVGSGVGNLQPQLIDCFRQLFSVALRFPSQFLNGLCHRVTLWDFFRDELALF